MRCRRVGFIVLLMIFACQRTSLGDDRAPDHEDVVESLRVGLQQWLGEVQFVATYERTFGRARTVDQAMQGQWDVTFDDRRVTGTMAKGLGIVRCSGKPFGPPRISSQSEDGLFKEIGNVPFDEVSNDIVSLSYNSKVLPQSARGEATFLPRNYFMRQGLEAGAAGFYSYRKPSPLKAGGGEIGSELSTPNDATDVSWSVLRADERAVVVKGAWKSPKVRAEKREVTFSLVAGSVPVVEATEVMEHYTTGQIYRVHAQAFDFVECPGGPVARTIRTALSNNHPKYPDLPWDVQEWRSDDLGDRVPVDDDFRVPIHDNVRIRGLYDPSAVRVDGKLDITKVKPNNLRLRDGDDVPKDFGSERCAPKALAAMAQRYGDRHRVCRHRDPTDAFGTCCGEVTRSLLPPRVDLHRDDRRTARKVQ